MLMLSRRRLRVLSRCLQYWAVSSIFLYVVVNTFLDPLEFAPTPIRQAGNVLWLIAHPDDESLFFSPSMVNLLRDGRANGYIMSLSSGNSEGLGHIRETELIASCHVYGIEPEHCVVITDSRLQDSMDVKDWWDANVIIDTVHPHVKKWDIDLIITFDKDGVSDHPNHKATNAAALQYSSNTSALKTPVVYTLQTTNILFKYTHLLSYPISLLRCVFNFRLYSSPTALLSSSFSDYIKAVEAFHKYPSQARWFRHIFYTISRYMWFNELVQVV